MLSCTFGPREGDARPPVRCVHAQHIWTRLKRRAYQIWSYQLWASGSGHGNIPDLKPPQGEPEETQRTGGPEGSAAPVGARLPQTAVPAPGCRRPLCLRPVAAVPPAHHGASVPLCRRTPKAASRHLLHAQSQPPHRIPKDCVCRIVD
jgi:hypothetical protein